MNREREVDEDDRREAMRLKRRRRRTLYRTYDDWKLATPEDEEPDND